jgi:hypothetical protein
MDDPILIAKIGGALVAFILGIWIGLGMPGMRRTPQKRDWRSADRLQATWINRLFFRMERPARRFDADRLIVPGEPKKKGAGESKNESDAGDEMVRLRRPGSR